MENIFFVVACFYRVLASISKYNSNLPLSLCLSVNFKSSTNIFLSLNLVLYSDQTALKQAFLCFYISFVYGSKYKLPWAYPVR